MTGRGREIVEDFIGSQNRGGGHVALGVALLAGIGLTTAALSRRGAEEVDRAGLRAPTGHGVVERPRGVISALFPILLSTSTLSALRVWNAPSERARSRALGLWAGSQLLNALIIAARPRRFGGQVAGAMAAAGLASAYAFEARKLDRRAATIAAPAGGKIGMSNLARDVLRRRTRDLEPA